VRDAEKIQSTQNNPKQGGDVQGIRNMKALNDEVKKN